MSRKRYWRRSSRWRRAWKHAKNDRHRFRLFALAGNENPFHAGPDTWLGWHAVQLSEKIYTRSIATSPWMDFIKHLNQPFPEGLGNPITCLSFQSPT